MRASWQQVERARACHSTAACWAAGCSGTVEDPLHERNAGTSASIRADAQPCTRASDNNINPLPTSAKQPNTSVSAKPQPAQPVRFLTNSTDQRVSQWRASWLLCLTSTPTDSQNQKTSAAISALHLIPTKPFPPKTQPLALNPLANLTSGKGRQTIDLPAPPFAPVSASQHGGRRTNTNKELKSLRSELLRDQFGAAPYRQTGEKFNHN